MFTQRFSRLVAVISFAALASTSVQAGSEAGSIHLRDQGFFWVGVRSKDVPANPNGGPFAAGIPNFNLELWQIATA